MMRSKGLTITIQKTKWLIMSKNAEIPRMELRGGGRTVERGGNFNHHGSIVLGEENG